MKWITHQATAVAAALALHLRAQGIAKGDREASARQARNAPRRSLPSS